MKPKKCLKPRSEGSKSKKRTSELLVAAADKMKQKRDAISPVTCHAWLDPRRSRLRR